LPLISDPNLIVGLESPDDAAVYKLREDLAIIQTIDYFTPIVDNPYDFGQIAAANALSDVYAMGGKPLTAMNIICFPISTMDISILQDILRGGLDKMHEAEVILVGGHSVEDAELKYGLSVTGVIHPQKIVTKAGAMVGDKLILTKPLGTGIINTAIKGELASEEATTRVTRYMVALNRKPADLMQATGVHACTDITGFGLLGHACEMIQDSKVGMEIRSALVPLLPEVAEFAQMGLVPAGTYRNKEFRSCMVKPAADVPVWMLDALFDPQTSGGLLISVSPQKAETLIKELHQANVKDAAIIGEVTEQPKGKIIIK